MGGPFFVTNAAEVCRGDYSMAREKTFVKRMFLTRWIREFEVPEVQGLCAPLSDLFPSLKHVPGHVGVGRKLPEVLFNKGLVDGNGLTGYVGGGEAEFLEDALQNSVEAAGADVFN